MSLDKHVPFLSIADAARETGLSQRFLRMGCQEGKIPHIMTGRKFLVNMPALLRQLDAMSLEGQGKREKTEQGEDL